jgi:16S rRNA processing protein RimM
MGSTPTSTSSTESPDTRRLTSPSALLEVGRITKPHGVRGEVIVTLVTNRTERLALDSVLYSDAGDLVVEASRPHQGGWIVRFAGIADRNAAERLRGLIVRAEPLHDPDVLWVHELVGAQVLDTDGRLLGRVEAVQANPASDLLVLDGGGLVPLAFVVAHKAGGLAGRVVVDPPAGLLESC